MSNLKPEVIQAAEQHLRRSDGTLARVLEVNGPCRLKRQTNRYRNLLRAIVGQQISESAAKAVFRRLEQAVPLQQLAPEQVAALSDVDLRSVGLSGRKVAYIRDLTEHVLDGRLNLRGLHHRSDDEVIAQLTAVKGIGLWTAQMFLMFSLGRPDVLPWGDLGIRVALRNLYQLEELPTRDVCLEIAEPWRPYATIASWHLWRTIDPA